MHGTPTTLRAAIEDIYRKFQDTAIDEEVRLWARDEIEKVQDDIDLMRRGREGYIAFLIEHLKREYERAGPDGDRELKLCTCGDPGCEIKNGKLPRRVRNADDVDVGVREFKQRHRGKPLVLSHEPESEKEPAGGRQQYRSKRRKVWSVVRTLQTYMTHYTEEPPSEDTISASDAQAGPEPVGGD